MWCVSVFWIVWEHNQRGEKYFVTFVLFGLRFSNRIRSSRTYFLLLSHYHYQYDFCFIYIIICSVSASVLTRVASWWHLSVFIDIYIFLLKFSLAVVAWFFCRKEGKGRMNFYLCFGCFFIALILSITINLVVYYADKIK